MVHLGKIGQIFLALVLFFRPGLVVTLPLWTRLRLPACLLAMTSATLSCLLGYAVFWSYFLSPLLGHVLGTGASLAGVAGLVCLWQHVSNVLISRLYRSPAR